MAHRSRNIHERFLRHIWSNQYVIQSNLKTIDGRQVNVLDAGELNFDGGPDFSGALVRIGETTFSGDVEIHRTSKEWLLHQHHNDARYNKVVLHVVLEGDSTRLPTLVLSGRQVPVLVLGKFLTESIRTIWQKTIFDERARRAETIPCYHKNLGIESANLDHWLGKLAGERLEMKLRVFEERLKELAQEQLMTLRETPRTWGEPPLEGFPEEIPPPLKELTQRDFAKKDLWEQLLYEGIMEGLGYSKNRAPFQRLARNVSLKVIEKMGLEDGGIKLDALLFGVAGLLPRIKTLSEESSKEYARQLIHAWNELRRSFRSEVLHATDWQFFPTRPVNFPSIRIAAASALIPKFFYGDILRVIVQTIKSSEMNPEKVEILRNVLRVSPSEFWLSHYNFDESSEKPTNALGNSRSKDVIINTVLPVALLYARIFRDSAVREGTLSLFETMSASAENFVTRRMESQLLKNRLKLNSASRQQAVIQLYKYYCEKQRCSECDVGKAVFGEVRKISPILASVVSKSYNK
ncbi:MAG TPA: DUF2851 family protein [Bacteroidota bacterium]|nr:DUF2851 family protein [Bacteroidota bacterium]